MTLNRIKELLVELGLEELGVNDKGWVLIRCPFAEWTHASGEDKNPDFWIKSEDQGGASGFHCFSCKTKGPIPSLVRKMEHHYKKSYGNLFVQAALWDNENSGGGYEIQVVDEAEPEPINPAIYGFLEAWHSPMAREYLQNRGVSEETCKLLSLKFDPDAKRIVFPVMNDTGNTFGFTGRTVIADYQGPKVKDYAGLRKEKFLLGEQLVVKGRPFWIVEGLFALAHMIELGVHHHFNVVALMGSSLSKYQRDILLYYNQPVYLCLDADMGGTEGLFGPWNEKKQDFAGGGIIDKLKDHLPTLLPTYPDGIEDPDQIQTLEQILAMSKNVKLF